MNEFIVRDATASDAQAICTYSALNLGELETLLPMDLDELPDVESHARLLAKYNSGEGGLWLIALVDDAVVGSVEVTPFRLKAMTHVVSIGISVTSRWRRHGVGATLLTSALRRIAGERPKCKRIELEVVADNIVAIALYRRHGFAEEGRHVRRYSIRGHMHDSVRMALEIPRPGPAALP